MGRTVNEHAALLTHTCIERTPIMKLNPFAKKAPSYLAGVKADYQGLQLELSAKESALQAAREDLSSYLQELASEEARFPNRHFRSETESALNRQADAARISIGTLEYAVHDLQREINKLSAIVNAAENLKEAKRTWTALRTLRQGLQNHLLQLEEQSHKLQSRITSLETQQYADIERAGQALIASDADQPVPESVARIDTQLRVAKTAQAQLAQQMQTVKDELSAVPAQLKEAIQVFKHCRATVAQVEMKEQVHSLAAIFAKASVSAYLLHYQGMPNKLEIELPDEVVEAIQDELSSEILDD